MQTARRAKARTKGPALLRALALVAAAALLAAPASVRCGRAFAWPSARAAARGGPRSGRGRRLPLRAGSDDFSLWAPDQRVVRAVEDLGGRVTKADVLEAGVEAKGLEQELLQLARTTGASMSVNSKGELMFEFPDDLSGALAASSATAKVQQIWGTVAPWLAYAGRVLFGVSLLAIVAVLYSAVVVLLSTSTSERENRDGSRSSEVSENSFSMWFGSDLFFWLTPRPYGYYSYYGGYMYGDMWGLQVEPPPKMSFFESVFSFVFGDGDPNKELREETRWQLVGETIAQNGGAVVAEQIAPFLDPPKGEGDGGKFDAQRALDRAMLPVLLRFRGRPEVGPAGDIVYVFPELQESRAAGELILGEVPTKELVQRLDMMGCRTTAVERAEIVADYRRAVQDLQRRQGASQVAASEYLPERELKFSEADEGQIAACIAFGGFALLATLFLGSQIATGKALILASVYPIMGLVTKAFPFLLAYSGAFLGIPLWRWQNLSGANEEIQSRNAWRSEKAQQLKQGNKGLQQRIAAAADFSKQRAGFGEALYDSSEPAGTAAAKSELDDMAAFDKRLRKG